jgi:hypothetical protein
MTLSGVSKLSNDEAAQIASGLPLTDTKVFVLPHGIHDKQSFFAAVRQGLPLDPPLAVDRENWDALEDSLWSGLYSADGASMIVVWHGADEMLRESPKDFERASAILEEIVRTLGDPMVTNGPVKRGAVVLGGNWNMPE